MSTDRSRRIATWPAGWWRNSFRSRRPARHRRRAQRLGQPHVPARRRSDDPPPPLAVLRRSGGQGATLVAAAGAAARCRSPARSPRDRRAWVSPTPGPEAFLRLARRGAGDTRPDRRPGRLRPARSRFTWWRCARATPETVRCPVSTTGGGAAPWTSTSRKPGPRWPPWPTRSTCGGHRDPGRRGRQHLAGTAGLVPRRHRVRQPAGPRRAGWRR